MCGSWIVNQKLHPDKVLKILVIIFALFISQAEAGNNKLFKQQEFIDKFVYQSVEPFNKQEIKDIRAYSKLIKEEQSPYSDAYNFLEVGAKKHKFHFKGVTVTGFYIPKKRFFLEKVEITTHRFKLSGGIQVGVTNKELIKYFKYSGIVKGNDITYIGESETVAFYFKHGLINKIVFYVYTG